MIGVCVRESVYCAITRCILLDICINYCCGGCECEFDLYKIAPICTLLL